MATSKISVFLRGATDELSKVLRDNGFLTVSPERENELSQLLEKFNDEMYGAPSAGSPRRKQTDVRVMTETPVVYDRDYLSKQSVQELLRIAKAKGCKNLGPRKKESLIEKLLQHLSRPADVEQENSEVSSQTSDITNATDAPTDDELRPEPVPEPAPVAEEPKEKKPRKKKEPTDEQAPLEGGASEPAKKGRKKKEETDEPKPERKKKEKSDEPKAERKKKEKPATDPAPAPVANSEEEEEVTIAVRSWIHPKEQDKPPNERTRYCIDPITNNIYNPDQLTDEPIGRWDEDAQEIIPC
jgi:hypothetical protein